MVKILRLPESYKSHKSNYTNLGMLMKIALEIVVFLLSVGKKIG